MEPNIELSKTRDFGEIISDSFLFIRQNLKPLVSCFFVFCGFFLLATAAASILQQVKMFSLLTDGSGYSTDGSPNPFLGQFTAEYLLAIFLSFLNYIAMPLTILSFMALYKEKGNIAPTNEEVWGYFKYYFLKVLGGSIVNGILLVIGFIFCFFPGIYLYPILALVFPIMIVENTTYGYAFNQTFRLIKEHWWTIFGALFITYLIAAICMGIIAAPFAAVNMWNVFLRHGAASHHHVSTPSVVLAVAMAQLAHVLYILPLVALGICYFSLAEEKDATGLMNRISHLGENTDTNAPTEEY